MQKDTLRFSFAPHWPQNLKSRTGVDDGAGAAVGDGTVADGMGTGGVVADAEVGDDTGTGGTVLKEATVASSIGRGAGAVAV